MPRDLLLITLSLFTWGIGEGMFIYFQPIYLQQFGANPLAIGAILGAAGVAMAIAQIPAGYLGDRYGTRPLLRASWVIGVAATILMAVAPSLSVLTIGLLLYALTAFVTPPMNSYITHARGNWSVGRALSFASGTYQLGAVIGPVAGGFLAQHYGIGIIFRFSAVIFLVSTVIVFFLRPQPIEPHDPTAPRAGFLHEHGFILFLGIMFITILATYMPQPLTSNFLQDQRGLSLESIGQLGSIACLGNAAFMFILGRINPMLAFLIGETAVAGFSLALWQGNGMLWFGMGYFLFGGFRLCRMMAAAIARPQVRPSEIGLAFGLVETVNLTAIILAPVLAGALYSHDPSSMYSTSIILLGISISAGVWFFSTHPIASSRAISDE